MPAHQQLLKMSAQSLMGRHRQTALEFVIRQRRPAVGMSDNELQYSVAMPVPSPTRQTSCGAAGGQAMPVPGCSQVELFMPCTPEYKPLLTLKQRKELRAKLKAGLASNAVHSTAKAVAGCHYAKEPILQNVNSPGENRSCRFQNCCHSLYIRVYGFNPKP